MGGNSTKATSGINGAGTQAQQQLGIPDNAKIFFDDTKQSVRFFCLLSLGTTPLTY
jgi:succinate dehydrogenase/fumarate reductase flavoprotein subunit